MPKLVTVASLVQNVRVTECALCTLSFSLGAKFKFAQQWGMKCVGPQWFHDSLDAGYCMPEDLYTVDSGGGAKGRSLTKPASKSAEVPEWASALESFKIPDIAGEEVLNSCKVRIVKLK